MSDLFAGLDVSTQSCKLVVIRPDDREVVHVDAVIYDDDLPQYDTEGGATRGLAEGVSESAPQMWIDAVGLVLDRLAETDVDRTEIRCISVSGQQHGLVALTADGSLARPAAKLWNDFSTTEECRKLTAAVGGLEAMIAEVGNGQRTGYTAAKILHMVHHERECYDRAATLFLVHNYVNWWLTGGPAGGVAVMEPGDTSGTALWHPATGAWSHAVLHAIAPDLADKLPPVQPSDRTIGNVAPPLAERFGLSPACRIDAGSGDNMYGAVGTGNVRPGILTVSLGTSGTAYTFLQEPFVDSAGEIAAFCDSTGHWLPLVCVSNMANGYDALLSEHGMSHADFDALVAETPVGNRGRVVVPWYEGERTPDVPDAAPLYFGFGLDDFDARHLSRGVLEGHVLGLWDGCDRLPVHPTEIRVTGGLSKSTAWCQAIADVFQAEAVPVQGEGAALGAAIHAAWVCGTERDDGLSAGIDPMPALEELTDRFVRLDEGRRARPDRASGDAALMLRRLYRALSRSARHLDAEDPFELRKALLRESNPRGAPD